MKDARKRLPFEKIVRPERRLDTFRRNDAAAKESDARSAGLDSCPGPLAHAEGPVTARHRFTISDLQAGAGRPGGTDSNALRRLHRSGSETIAIFTHQFACQQRKACQIGSGSQIDVRIVGVKRRTGARMSDDFAKRLQLERVDLWSRPLFVASKLAQQRKHAWSVAIPREEPASRAGQKILNGIWHPVIDSLQRCAVGAKLSFDHGTS